MCLNNKKSDFVGGLKIEKGLLILGYFTEGQCEVSYDFLSSHLCHGVSEETDTMGMKLAIVPSLHQTNIVMKLYLHVICGTPCYRPF